MHPAMAVWIWSVAMMRAVQPPFFNFGNVAFDAPEEDAPIKLRQAPTWAFVPAIGYLQTDIAKTPLPAPLLDRLADLYWMERDSELAI